jgi:hypothetical protein
MGDEPDVVEKIHAHQFGIKNMDKLLKYYNDTVAAHKTH